MTILPQNFDFKRIMKEYRLSATFSVLLFALSVYALILIFEDHFWTPFFGAQSSSVVFFSIVFIGVVIHLIRMRTSDLECFSTALATTFSVIWFYELIYHYSFPGDYSEFVNLQFNTFIMETGLTLLVLVGYRRIRIRRNNYFVFMVMVFSILYVLWLVIGFPQYDGTFQLPRFLNIQNPFLAGYVLNRFSKLFLCLAWVSLYRVKRMGTRNSQI